jgi:hypothetical protein
MNEVLLLVDIFRCEPYMLPDRWHMLAGGFKTAPALTAYNIACCHHTSKMCWETLTKLLLTFVQNFTLHSRLAVVSCHEYQQAPVFPHHAFIAPLQSSSCLRTAAARPFRTLQQQA